MINCSTRRIHLGVWVPPLRRPRPMLCRLAASLASFGEQGEDRPETHVFWLVDSHDKDRHGVHHRGKNMIYVHHQFPMFFFFSVSGIYVYHVYLLNMFIIIHVEFVHFFGQIQRLMEHLWLRLCQIDGSGPVGHPSVDPLAGHSLESSVKRHRK